MKLCVSGGDEFLLCLGILFHGIWESKAHCFLDVAVIEVLIKWRVAYLSGSFFIQVHVYNRFSNLPLGFLWICVCVSIWHELCDTCDLSLWRFSKWDRNDHAVRKKGTKLCYSVLYCVTFPCTRTTWDSALLVSRFSTAALNFSSWAGLRIMWVGDAAGGDQRLGLISERLFKDSAHAMLTLDIWRNHMSQFTPDGPWFMYGFFVVLFVSLCFISVAF